jgi:inner membrane protein
VDNITHTLVGIALADVVTRGRATKTERRVSVGAGIIGANLPDIDLAYSAITPPAPLGYLLHHRGHTHTVLGVAVLALGLIAAYRLLPGVRRMPFGDRVRFWLLIAGALASHLLLDALNSYGVHPFHPFDSAWYFGDAVFIFEPWLWIVLGIAAAWNARGRFASAAVWLPIVILPVAIVSMGIIPIEAAVALAIVGAIYSAAVRRLPPRARAGVALTATVLIIAALSGLSRLARREVAESLTPELRGRPIDVVLTPNPASPLCWAFIGIELDEEKGEYVLRRGTLSLTPAWKAPTACASHRFAGPRRVRTIGGGRIALTDEMHQSLAQLRQLARSNCTVRGWLQFGRAPVIADGKIFDLRFGDRIGQNFSYMTLTSGQESSVCPPFLPGWGTPRADLLDE